MSGSVWCHCSVPRCTSFAKCLICSCPDITYNVSLNGVKKRASGAQQMLGHTLSLVNYGGFSHVAFCCCVTWKGPCGASVTTDFFFEGANVAGLLRLHSHAGLPWGCSQNHLFVDPTTRQEWCRGRPVASPLPSLGCVQICLVLPVLTNPAFRLRLLR